MKIDLHNHTIFSHDSINKQENFEQACAQRKFDLIAITDHKTIHAAQALKAKASFPVIVGLEIATGEGDLIGLFLDEIIKENLGADATARKIRAQNGLVYVPHPLDRLRVGMRGEPLAKLADANLIDLVELYNGKYASLLLSRNNHRLSEFIHQHHLIPAAGSDAHMPSDLGRAFVEVSNHYDPHRLANDPQLLLTAIRHGEPKNLSRLALTHGLTIVYANLRRKLIAKPQL